MADTPPQIGADMLPQEHDAFCAYADSLHLKDSALANLLIARELRQKRLSCLAQDHFKKVPKAGSRRITAHQASSATKRAFTEHAAENGHRVGPAAAILFRTELQERWLARCLDREN